uniref:Uncharacterized protein n=1 Tax=Arundo donax TaxID=35708 RepID=A0A0A9G4T5_ARUDO
MKLSSTSITWNASLGLMSLRSRKKAWLSRRSLKLRMRFTKRRRKMRKKS